MIGYLHTRKYRYRFIIVLIFSLQNVIAQIQPPRTLRGMVLDYDKRIRLTKVFVRNLHTQIGQFNNFRGEFSLKGFDGDTVIAEVPGYRPDTSIIRSSQLSLVFYLKADGQMLPQVTVKQKKMEPKSWFDEKNTENQAIYRKNDSDNLLSSGNGSAGISIAAIYNMFSHEGKDVRKMQLYIEKEYQERVVDQRFNLDVVHHITNLQGDSLIDFMQQYRPSYFFVLLANDYDFVRFIKQSFRNYQINPDKLRLPQLQTSH